MAVAALVVSVVSALAAVGAVWFARVSGRSAAKQVGLEVGRRKDELTPRLVVSWKRGDEFRGFGIGLAGPPGLEWVDDIQLVVRPNARVVGMDGDRSALGELVAPYRFYPAMEDEDYSGWTHRTGPVHIGEKAWCEMDPTPPPSAMSHLGPDEWLRECGSVLRLRVYCERREWGRWAHAVEIDTARESGIVEVS